MTLVVVTGYAPDATDLTDASLPKGLHASKIAAALERDHKRMAALVCHEEHLPIRACGDVRQRVLNRLHAGHYDCIVNGGGVRMTAKHDSACAQAVNAVRESAPQTHIACRVRRQCGGTSAV